MTKEQQQQFVAFLLNHEALSNYVENVNECNNSKEDVQTILDHTPPTNAIIAAFSWSQSEQGYDYWSRLHIQWVTFVMDVLENNPTQELKTLVLEFIKEQKMNPRLTEACNDMHDYVSKYSQDKFVKVHNIDTINQVFES
jgi:hypothetical protein